MPIYEYRCEACGRKNTVFRLSVSAAEAAQAGLSCERCGSSDLRRIVSGFSLGRAAPGEGEELYQFDRMTAGLDDNDPAQLSRWAESLGAEPEAGENSGDGELTAFD